MPELEPVDLFPPDEDGFFRRAGFHPVSWSEDLQRIEALPRRTGYDLVQGQALEASLSRGTASLRPVQVQALLEARDVGGVLGIIKVGGGKALLSLLLPVVMGADNAMLLVPPSLKPKVFDQDVPFWASQFRIANVVGASVHDPDMDSTLHVYSHAEISSQKKRDLLTDLKPKLIIIDEAHAFAHAGAARTKRLMRYMRAHPEVKCVFLSGTMVSKSIKDFAHLSKYALKKNSPLPLEFRALEEWAHALDPSPSPAPPGALERLCSPGEEVRKGFHRRLVETPGVVASENADEPWSINFYERALRAPEPVEAALKQLRAEWKVPDGRCFESALDLYRYGSQISAGLYMRWIWPRGEDLDLRREWMEARKNWSKEVRERLARNLPGQDSPGLCEQAAKNGTWKGPVFYKAWTDIKDACEPENETVWISDYLADDAVKWGNESPGIIWYQHSDLGRKIAEKGGFVLFGGGKEASEAILKETGTRTIVASIASHGTGKDLQHAFYRNYVTTPPSSGTVWEQLIGRTHRHGQKRDEVEFYMPYHTPELRKKFLNAYREKATFLGDITGKDQKLLQATYTFNLDRS